MQTNFANAFKILHRKPCWGSNAKIKRKRSKHGRRVIIPKANVPLVYPQTN